MPRSPSGGGMAASFGAGSEDGYMSTDSTADGYSSARGGFSDTEPPSLSLSPPPPGRKVGGGEYSKHWDEANQSYV